MQDGSVNLIDLSQNEIYLKISKKLNGRTPTKYVITNLGLKFLQTKSKEINEIRLLPKYQIK